MGEGQKGLDLRIQRIGYVAPRLNRGIEFVLVIDGELKIETRNRIYRLKEKDLLIINRNELFEMQGNKQNSVLRFTISDTYMDQFYEEYRNSRFECFSGDVDMGREVLIVQLRTFFGEMVITYFRNDEIYAIEMQRLVSEILLILIRRFKEDGSVFEKLNTEDERLVQIVDYLERNFQESITLNEIADKMHVSPGYLSRYFKQEMGMGFSRFLMNIRLKHSVKDLLYTSDSISHIAMKNGFPNTKSFANFFKEEYEETPKAYRDHHVEGKVDTLEELQMEDVDTLINSKEIFSKLGSLLSEKNNTYSNTESRHEELHLDVTKTTHEKLYRPDHVLIIRELKEILREDVREQVLTVKNELRLNFIGVRNLVGNTTFLPTVETDELIATSSPYFTADLAINFLIKHDLSIFSHVDYQDISIDEEAYFLKLHGFLHHCLLMYGESYVSKWHILYFEPYYSAVDGKELQRIYEKLYTTLKKIVPKIQVGVYIPFSIEKEITSDHHAWLLQDAGHIDFIGFHVNQNEAIDFDENRNDRFLLAKDYIKEKTTKLKNYLKKLHIEKPLHLTSWNTLTGNTRYTNGVFFRGALVMKNVLEISKDVQSIGFWINTELHEIGDQHNRIQLEGMELFHYFKGKRPAYHAMAFAEKLSGNIIAQGEDYILTEYEGGYHLVLMNCSNINPYFSIEDAFLRQLNKDIRVTISNLKPGEYQVRKYIFDKDNGALYKNWGNLSSIHGVDLEVTEYINRLSYPSMQIFDETIAGDWSFYSYLSINAIHFFDIRKTYNNTFS